MPFLQAIPCKTQHPIFCKIIIHERKVKINKKVMNFAYGGYINLAYGIFLIFT